MPSQKQGIIDRIKGYIPIRRLVADNLGHKYRLCIAVAATAGMPTAGLLKGRKRIVFS